MPYHDLHFIWEDQFDIYDKAAQLITATRDAIILLYQEANENMAERSRKAGVGGTKMGRRTVRKSR